MKHYFLYQTKAGKVAIAEEQGKITDITLANSFCMKGMVLKETPLIKEAAAQINKYFDGKIKTFDLPLNPQGTAFQRSVWEALCKIPYGATKTYKDIAIAIKNPKAMRAVGGANNKNPIFIVIPCHRVIGADGSLTGYAGGLGMKKDLLEMEAKYSV